MSSFTDSGILLLLGQNVLLVKRHMDSALKSVKFLFLSFFGVGGQVYTVKYNYNIYYTDTCLYSP